MKLRAILGLALAAAAAACAGGAAAQTFPSKPLTLICPWPPGGSTDVHLRKFAEIAQKYLGQPIVVENKPGASGTLGPSTMAATARADGYTLAQYPITLIRVAHMQKASWDPLKDFSFILGLTGYTFGVVVKSDAPFRSLQDLIEYARANPGRMSFGSTGNGTSPHLLMEEMAMKTGVRFLHVPFKGNADSTQALMGGHVMAQSDASGWGRFVDAGTFRLLVTFGGERTRWGAPTAQELSYDVVSYSTYGIVGPKGMDPNVVKILHDAFKTAVDDPENRKVLQQLDQVDWYRSSDDYARWAVETFASERAMIEKLGLIAK